MAGFVFKEKPKATRSSKSGSFEDIPQPIAPLHGDERGQNASAGAANTLNNIDDVLNQNEADMMGAGQAPPETGSSTTSDESGGAPGSSGPNRSSERFRSNRDRQNGPQRTTTRRTPGKTDAANTLEGNTPALGHTNTSGHSGKDTAKSSSAKSGDNRLDIHNIIAKASRLSAFAKQNKKGLAAGGGAAGLIALLIVGMFALLPFKLSALMKAIYGEAFDRVEHSMERRAERFFIRFAMQSAISSEGGVVATGNIIGDLYKTWQVQRSQKKFYERQGLRITQGSERGTIRVSLPEGETQFRNAREFDEFLNRDLRGREARRFLALVASDQTHFLRVFRRRHVRVWAMKAWGIPNWRIWERRTPPPAEGNVANQAARAALSSEVNSRVNRSFIQRIGGAFTCIISRVGCPSDTRATAPENTTPVQGEEAGRAASTAASEAIEESTTKGFAKALSEKLSAQLLKKVIPVIGWIDVLARIDDCFWNRCTEGLMKGLREAQYAGAYLTMATVADQFSDGYNADGTPIQPEQLDATLSMLEGAEKSRAYQEMFAQKSAGEDIAKGDDLNINDGTDSTFDQYRIQHIADHWIYVAYLKTGGKVLDLIGEGLGWLISMIPGVADAFAWLLEQLVDLLKWLVGPVCHLEKEDSNLKTSIRLLNCTRLGGHLIANEFMHQELGGKKVTPAAARQHKELIAAERRLDKVSLWDRLFSTDRNLSMINRLAIAVPVSPMKAARDSFNRGLAAIANPLAAVGGGLKFALDTGSGRAYADFDSKIAAHGVQFYDYSEDELMREPDVPALEKAWEKAQADGRTISQVRPEDCPEVDEGKVNLCKLDIVTAQSLKSIYTKEDDGGVNSDPITGPTPNPNGGPANLGEMCRIGSDGAEVSQIDCAAYWAQQVKNNPNIIKANAVVTQDLDRAIAKQPTRNSSTTCSEAGGDGNAWLHPALLFALQRTATAGGFKITIWNFISGHDCDRFLHPHGRATDIGAINGVSADSVLFEPTVTNIQFGQYIDDLLPAGSHILQSNCFPIPGLNPNVRRGSDGCNHIHVDVGTQVP